MTMRPRQRHLWLIAGLVGAGGLLIASLSTSGDAPVAVAAQVRPATPPAGPSSPPQEAPQPAAPATDLSQLRLHGLTATGAIIGTAAGQRLIVLGREVLPGVTLQEVGQHHAVLATTSGPVELGFRGPEAAGSSGGAAESTTTTNAVPVANRSEVAQYRSGLAPRRQNGRITGFALRNGSVMPMLQRAGLRPGDILIGVNGQTFDSEEKVLELAREIAGSYTAEFEFERAGRRMRASLPVNPRT
jgi:general secretion pathway protein C